jgi:SpoVK/Ycf46/Vps4 family AAA+-type ATPase
MSREEELLTAIFGNNVYIRYNREDDLAPLLALPADKYLKILKTYKDYQPLSTEEQFLKEAFNKDPEELVTTVMRFPTYKHLLAHKSLFAALNGWKIITGAIVDHHNMRKPIEYIAYDVDYGVTEDTIKEGSLIMEGPDRQRLVVRFNFIEHREEGKPRSDIFLTCEKEKKKWLKELENQINKWIDDNNYLKGKKIKPGAKFLDVSKKYTWDDILLPEDTKEDIKRNINDYFELREIYKKNNLPFKRGIICYGQPGTGKTLLGKVIASQIESTFIWVTPSDVETPRDVSDIFEMARNLSPTILFFEDLDFYASIREGNDKSGVLGEFLAQMDGFIQNEDIFIIATTNDIKVIEPALKNRPSRFDSLIEFKPMDENLRAKMIKRLLNNYTTKEDPETIANETAKLLKSMTGAELNKFFISTIKTAIEERSIDTDKKVILTLEIFKKAVKNIGTTEKRLMGFGN